MLVLPALASALMLGGCAAQADAAHSATASGVVSVVASTSVYGDIAKKVGGDHVDVTSIIDSPNKDPHEYQVTAQNQLAIAKARIVIENGGGYDDFVGTMLKAAERKSRTVLNAVEISGKRASGSANLNEHVWYDFPTIGKLVDRLVSVLSKAEPGHAATFTKNGDAFRAKLATLESSEANLKSTYAGVGVAITEPVPLYMLDAIGLDNKTPVKFSEAIEDDTDVAVDELQKTLALYSSGAVKLLVYNAQTAGPQTEAMVKAAKDNHIPVVPVTETLPARTDYISWMTANLHAISHALVRSQ